jgi:hypothetical protein
MKSLRHASALALMLVVVQGCSASDSVPSSDDAKADGTDTAAPACGVGSHACCCKSGEGHVPPFCGGGTPSCAEGFTYHYYECASLPDCRVPAVDASVDARDAAAEVVDSPSAD